LAVKQKLAASSHTMTDVEVDLLPKDLPDVH